MTVSGAEPSFHPLTTERLVLRAPVLADLDAIVARRNDPEVARYQDWIVPHPRERSEARLNAAIEQGGLADGEWWSVAVCLAGDDRPIGDLAVKITAGWRTAEIGYSFDSDRWGSGYATEAVAAMLDHLFDDRGILRVAATLHPDNVASAMLLERLGFLHEGVTKESFWLGDGPDAQNTDESFYGLTKTQREAWRARATGRPDDVQLVAVTHENQRKVGDLVTHHSQDQMVAPVVYSFADALFPAPHEGHPVRPTLWAIEADGDLAGFVMIADVTEHHPEPYLWRLLIDRRFQRRGIGARACDLVEEHCRSQGASSITVSWVPGRGSPEPFYLRRRYVPTGRVEDGEIEGRLQL